MVAPSPNRKSYRQRDRESMDATDPLLDRTPERPGSADAELAEMTDELEQFLLRQLDRLETEFTELGRKAELLTERSLEQTHSEQQATSEPLPASVSPAVNSATEARFVREREAWESQRQEEAERLQKEATLLQEAWQRLEEEQRRLLAEKELVRRGVPLQSAGSKSDREPRSAGALVGAATPDAAQSDDKSAWLQFQRMRREIQSHAHPRS